MYSIVIPTMWKVDSFEQMMYRLLSHNLVQEIIVINNDFDNTPEWFKATTSDKIRIYNFQKNIYVNPAWNLGVRESKNDKICLLSDDVLCDTFLFDYMYDKMTPELGVVGLHIDCYYLQKYTNYPQSSIGLVDCHKQEFGFASLLLVNKKNYVDIPESYLIYFGDNWIFHTHQKMGKTPRMIVNFTVHGTVSNTSGLPEFSGVLSREWDYHQSEIGQTEWKNANV